MFPIRDNNPTHGTAFVTISLIIVNAGIFLFQPSKSGISDFTWRYGFVPAQLMEDSATFDAGVKRALVESLTRQLAGRQLSVRDQAAIGGLLQQEYEAVTSVSAPVKLVTSMFLHGGWMHLIGNMLFLWIFGNNIEDRLGPFLFLIFYLVTGVLATLTHAWFAPDYIPLVGASGAISGVMGAYLVLFPKARILAVAPVGYYPLTVSLPAWIFMIFYVVIQNIYPATFSAGQGGGVAYLAHLGGFAAGAALIWFVPKRKHPPIVLDESVDDADFVL